jgi:hypothetical protein
MQMRMRPAIVFVSLIVACCPARAQDFRIEDTASVRSIDVAQLKPGTIAFNDQAGGSGDGETSLIHFDDWARTRPVQKKFLSLFPGYTEPKISKATKPRTPTKTGPSADAKADAKPDVQSADIKPDPKAADANADAKPEGKAEGGPVTEKLYMYVAQARFLLDRAPAGIDLSRYVTLPFLEKIDPAIKHQAIAAADLPPLTDARGIGNENPDRKWCTGRPMLICIRSSYALEGKIPLGIMLANKLRDSSKKISDHIAFDSELSLLSPADIDQAGLKELTELDAPVAGVLEQNIFYVNQIMKFGKFLAVFQNDPADADKTVVTAFMGLAVEAGVFDKKREFEKVPVLRNLVPEQVLLGKSSFNSGQSISAGLPKYARNEIKTIAGVLERDK